MNKLLSATSLFALTLTFLNACQKDPVVNTLQPPALTSGLCDYKKAGYTQDQAIAELARLNSIFTSSTLDGTAISVTNSLVYVSQTTNNVADQWGVEVVFSCGSAAINFEDVHNFYSIEDAQSAVDIRVAQLNNGLTTKVIDSGAYDNSTESCDTCSSDSCDTCIDDNGDSYDCNCTTSYYDCNCSYSDDYYYEIAYFQVKPSSVGTIHAVRSAFVNNYLNFKAAYKTVTGKSHVSITDTLSAAHQYFKGFDEGRIAGEWKSLLNRLHAPAAKKAAPFNLKAFLTDKSGKKRSNLCVKPASKHFVLPSKKR